jgi:hypothetical protein
VYWVYLFRFFLFRGVEERALRNDGGGDGGGQVRREKNVDIVPPRVFEDVALDDGREVRAVVAHADVGLEDLILGGHGPVLSSWSWGDMGGGGRERGEGGGGGGRSEFFS